MASMLIQHKVKDFAEWRKVFEAHEGLRKSSGELSHQIFRDASDPNKLVTLNTWKSLAEAQKFASSPELRAAMAEAGVEGIPLVSFLNDV
jgi:quinol monooxygenase YgiN